MVNIFYVVKIGNFENWDLLFGCRFFRDIPIRAFTLRTDFWFLSTSCYPFVFTPLTPVTLDFKFYFSHITKYVTMKYIIMTGIISKSVGI